MSAQPKLLNVGGNNKQIAIPSWYRGYDHLILDIDASAKPDIVCDARTLDTLAPGQFDAIYCSHNLEHYFAHDVPRVLKGFRHVLKPGGFAEVRVPDLNAVMRHYVEKNMDLLDTLYDSPAGPITVRDVLYGFGKEIERKGVDFYAHKTGFTWKSLTAVLNAAGFQFVAQKPGRLYELAVLAFSAPPSLDLQKLLNVSLAPQPLKSGDG